MATTEEINALLALIRAGQHDQAAAMMRAPGGWPSLFYGAIGRAFSSALFETSASSVAVGNGTKTFTLDSSRLWPIGTPLYFMSDADPTGTVMAGHVTTAEDQDLGITVNIVWSRGTGSHSDWTILPIFPVSEVLEAEALAVDFALLAGRAGGQTQIGGTGSGDAYWIVSTSHATKGLIRFGEASLSVYNEVNNRWGVGTSSPAAPIHVLVAQNSPTEVRIQNNSTGVSATSLLTAMTGAAQLVARASSLANTGTVMGFALAGWTDLTAVTGEGLAISTTFSRPIVIGTFNTERMRIEADGTVKLYQTVASAATFTKTADTTLAAITGLSFTVAAGRSYRFVADLGLNAPAGGGYKLAIGGTATATTLLGWLEVTSNTPALALCARLTVMGTGAGLTAAITGRALITGTITVNAGGTLAPMFAQNAASGASDVVAGSSFQIWPI